VCYSGICVGLFSKDSSQAGRAEVAVYSDILLSSVMVGRCDSSCCSTSTLSVRRRPSLYCSPSVKMHIEKVRKVSDQPAGCADNIQVLILVPRKFCSPRVHLPTDINKISHVVEQSMVKKSMTP